MDKKIRAFLREQVRRLGYDPDEFDDQQLWEVAKAMPLVPTPAQITPEAAIDAVCPGLRKNLEAMDKVSDELDQQLADVLKKL